jgi:colanic acid biosynthesis glycosyl transferase WcaI
VNIVVHDYSGHPFQVQLSRALAARGHSVLHQYCPSYATGKGALAPQPGDLTGFAVETLTMSGEFARYSPVKRVAQELRYGVMLGRRLRAARPDVVLMCNIPLLAHLVAALMLWFAGIRMVFWHQDVYSHAITTQARRALGPVLGGAVGFTAQRAERWIARHSAHVVAIAEDFRPVLSRWGVPADRVTIVPNWAAIGEMPERPRDNAWAQSHDLVGRPTVLYSGTLGFKHNPRIFSALARALAQRDPRARVVVVSEGQGRDWLETERAEQGLDNLVLLDYQPYEQLPDVLASADVLITVLEPDASLYSVPSKVLNYLCAARPVVGVMPRSNSAATTLLESGAGIVSDPGDEAGILEDLLDLLADRDRGATMGAAGRRHAEATFAIAPIAARFEGILSAARRGASKP